MYYFAYMYLRRWNFRDFANVFIHQSRRFYRGEG